GLLRTELRLMDYLIHAIVADVPGAMRLEKRPSKAIRDVLPLMIQGAGSSCHSILLLSDEIGLPVRDCFSIARGVVEALINSCYIVAVGDEAADKAGRHAFQKAYRDFKRSSEI